MKLELKHLAGYLPYGLRIKTIRGIENMSTLTDNIVNIDYNDVYYYNQKNETNDFKPILRPLSDLTKEIEVNGEKFVPIVELLKLEFPDQEKKGRYSEITISENSFPNACYTYQANRSFTVYTNYINTQPYWVVEKLLEWHFDTYGLIEKGWAININTL